MVISFLAVFVVLAIKIICQYDDAKNVAENVLKIIWEYPYRNDHNKIITKQYKLNIVDNEREEEKWK